MGGSRVTFTVSRDGQNMPVTIDVPYVASGSGRADANLTQPEIDLVSQRVRGLIGQGFTITGDTFTIVEDDSDLRTPPTARATATVPAAVLMGTAPVQGGNPQPQGAPPPPGGRVGPGTLGFTVVRDTNPPQAYYQRELYLQRPNGEWEPANPRPVRPGQPQVAAVPDPNPNPAGDRPNASGPARRSQPRRQDQGGQGQGQSRPSRSTPRRI